MGPMAGPRIIVIGCGAMGSAAAWHLAQRGAQVLVLDRYAPGHDHGSSHGHSRVIRQAYFEHPDYVPMLRRSYSLFRQLEAETGHHLLELAGALFCGRLDGEVVHGARMSASLHQVNHELLDRDELRRRWPALGLPEDHVAVWEPGAGYVFPERTVHAQAALAEKLGAVLQLHEPALGWSRDGSGVRVETEAGVYLADKLVITAGAWAGRLLPGLPLQVTRQLLGWVDPAPELPVWLVDQHDGSAVYGIPAVDEGPAGMKVAVHAPGRVSEPDDVDRRVSTAERAELSSLVQRCVPGAAAVHAVTTCLYTNTADKHFVIDTFGDHVIAAAGFSGHGFKFAPVIGEILADLALLGRTDWPISLFSKDRLLA